MVNSNLKNKGATRGSFFDKGIASNDSDFPEAETMETRKVKTWSGARTFWTIAFSIAVLMTLGNYIVSVISQ